MKFFPHKIIAVNFLFLKKDFLLKSRIKNDLISGFGGFLNHENIISIILTESIKSSRRVGRPTFQEELEIQNLIKPYYDIGLSAEYTALQKGISVKTVRKHFKIWTDRLRENFEVGISERQKNTRAREIQNIDSIIFNFRAQLNRITKAILAHEKTWEMNNSTRQDGKATCYRPDPYLEDKYTKLNELLLKAYDRKASIEAAPTIDEESEKAVFQRLAEKSSKIPEAEDE